MSELRYAVRSMARQPGFALLAGLSLAIGIGANAAIYSVIDAVLLRPLPEVANVERVVGVVSDSVSYPTFARSETPWPDCSRTSATPSGCSHARRDSQSSPF